jgi:hypothetical protein
MIFSKHSETDRGESESWHGESVEDFDQKVERECLVFFSLKKERLNVY